jgi:hypothetical protein
MGSIQLDMRARGNPVIDLLRAIDDVRLLGKDHRGLLDRRHGFQCRPVPPYGVATASEKSALKCVSNISMNLP